MAKSALAAMFLMAVVTAAAEPPQARPSNPEAFVGVWEGEWYDSSGSVGHLDVIIKPPEDNALRILVRATNAIAPGFGGETRFVSGELVLDEPRLRIILVFRLQGNNRLEADYHYRDRPNTGKWSLVRKKASGT